ncbi:uncharacterized protein LOC128158591 isoform X2 [Crassostrea angulata]|uniref:uncharacterized protein LOC128158591 isoform X2 n=1 Tax=Magallana angulata TaxID=2784310 RepID=UPI0022B08831|nr:uncharacterized protein LOC128158591 isoform X2 [Crassostrea angulata]
MNENMDVNDFIWDYALKGISYKCISTLLSSVHSVHLSPNAIKKRMHRRGCPRKRGSIEVSDHEIKSAITEIDSKPYTVGYRCMYDTLRMRGLQVRRDSVMQFMKEIDPIGCEFRRRRRIIRRIYKSSGPNDTWHIDGYDKLKPYGLSIHGCIDGYSRKIMWLRVGSSNNDPTVIARYYLRCVMECGGCPSLLQSDPGTENVLVGSLQSLFVNSEDGFKIVRSAFNQRIEAWWSMLRRRFTSWWIDFFRDLASFNSFEIGNENDIRCIRFCFSSLIQRELDEVKNTWNHHHISHSRQAVVPNGKPIILYNAPEVTGGKNCLKVVNEDDLQWAFTQCSDDSISGSQDFDDEAGRILNATTSTQPESWEECLERYFQLSRENIIKCGCV